MKKRLITLIAALTVFVGIAVMTAAPAQATNAWGCPNGIACLYTGYNGGGTRLQLSVGQYGANNCINLASLGWSNITSSATVDYGSGLDLELYDSDNCNGFGTTFSIQTGQHVTFAGSNAFFDNIASSAKIQDIF